MLTFSVITICRNAEKVIQSTMQSVLEQSYENIEYIVCDGNSSDNTMNIISHISADYNRNIKVYCENDFGIYNAMNRGIARVTGEYSIFMNAGDRFFDFDVIAKAARYIERKRKDIYFGKTQIVDEFDRIKSIEDFQKEFPVFMQGLFRGRMPCHQSIIARTDCLQSHYFNEQYKYRTDFEWLVSCCKRKKEMEALDFLISVHDNTGLTSRIKTKSEMKKETRQILEQYYPLWYKWQALKVSLFDNE